MKRKRIILAVGFVALLLGLFAILARSGGGDVSKVRIGFEGYSVVDGEHSLNLIVTNGSSYRISQPNGTCKLRGVLPDSTLSSARFKHSTSFSSGSTNWGWWQLKPPKILSVAPGATFRFTIPVEEGPYTWHVTIPFTTIPFRDRLPFALRSRWPSSGGDKAISFDVSSPPIPPAPSQVSGSVSRSR